MNKSGIQGLNLALGLVILCALLISCKYHRKYNYTEQYDLSSVGTVGSLIDSTFWLKPSKGIRGIFEDSKGQLWFTSTDFLARFDGLKFTYFTEEDGLCGMGRVQEDKNGKIWVETGIEICSYVGVQFSTYPLKPEGSMDQWQSSPDDLWFYKGMKHFGKTEGAPGVYRYHEGKISFLPFPVPRCENEDNLYMSSTAPIKGKDGRIWFGLMELVIGFGEGKFTKIGREEMGRQNDSRNMGIRGIYHDSKGDLWIADNGAGVFVYNGDTIIHFTGLHHLDKGDKEGNTLHRVFSISEDDEGNMWFGTVYSGIWRYDGQSFTNFTKENGVKSDVIWTIFKTKGGELLFAGEDPGGVYKFNGTSFDRIY